MNGTRPEVSIVIVTWKVRDLVNRCLQTIREGEPTLAYEILVVDNDSRDGTMEMLAQEHPGVIAVDTGQNLGFSGGNNRGFAMARGRTVLLLNPDTEISPGTVSRLLGVLDSSPNLGMVGPKVLLPSGKIQFPCARNFPTLRNQFFEILGLAHKHAHHPVFGHYRMSHWDHLDERDVEAISGCCMLIRKDLLDVVGGLDESYFMYGEDLDLCFQVRRRGARIRYVPSAKILHLSEQSSAQNQSPLFVETFESMFKFFRKNRGFAVAVIYRGMMGLFSLFWIVAENVRASLVGKERAQFLRKDVIPMYFKIWDWVLHGSRIGRAKP